MPEIVDWNGAEPVDVLSQAVRHLAEGRLVALPTESLYEVAAPALRGESVAALCDLADEPPAVVLSGPAEVHDWLPFLRGPGARLVRKPVPSAWRLRADGGVDFGLVQRLPAEVRDRVARDGSLALRMPEHPAWGWTTRLLRQPLVSAAFSGAATTAQQAAAILGDGVALVVDGGPCQFGKPTTVVRAAAGEWTVEREGVLSAEDVAEIVLWRVIFLCTGNTCRSPMAEALFARLLADRHGCAPAELRGRGFLVQSAGLAAMMGEEAAGAAVAAVAELGGDLSGHRSQPLTLDLLALADHVYAMTASHLYALAGVAMPGLPPVQLLAPEGKDVADPIGAEAAVYRACAEEILAHLRKRLLELGHH